MSCAVFTLIGVIVLAYNKSNKWALWVTFGAAVALLFVASFLAWRDQYRHANDLLRLLKPPAGSLTLQAVQINSDDTTQPATLQLWIVLLNSFQGPITYRVETMNVILDGHTITTPKFLNRGGIIPGGTSTNFYYPPFDAGLFAGKKRIDGTVELIIGYGHPDLGITRNLTKTLDVFVRVGNPNATFLVTNEKDEMIKE